jgi:heme oxygenase
MTTSARGVTLHGAAARLRADSATIHRQTEEEAFIVELLAGRRRLADYAALAAQLRWIYEALEQEVSAARASAPVRVAALFDPRLDRLGALDHDLRALNGAAPFAHAAPLTETAAYVDRIHAAADPWPTLLAHHYVRYLGDLSGGQIVADRLRHHYGIGDDALTFYAFDGIGSKGGFKTRYREGLDAVLADPAIYVVTRDEVIAAYAANREIFAALA